jgi:hypothetical protein
MVDTVITADMVIMVVASDPVTAETMEQVICVVIYGVPIPVASVWEGI